MRRPANFNEELTNDIKQKVFLYSSHREYPRRQTNTKPSKPVVAIIRKQWLFLRGHYSYVKTLKSKTNTTL